MRKVFTELMNQISDIKENTNAFDIAKNIIFAYKREHISSVQFEMIVHHFEMKCSTYNIDSYNEVYYTELHNL